MIKKENITIFDYLNAIFYKQSIKYDKKIVSSYILSLWLSHDKTLLSIVNRINKYHFLLKDDLIYQYYFDKIPKGKRYIKWVKKDEKEVNLTKKITAFRDETGISKKEANFYLTFFKKDDIISNKNKSVKDMFFE